eukprot:3010307-Rhodomonas_salina.1
MQLLPSLPGLVILVGLRRSGYPGTRQAVPLGLQCFFFWLRAQTRAKRQRYQESDLRVRICHWQIKATSGAANHWHELPKPQAWLEQ